MTLTRRDEFAKAAMQGILSNHRMITSIINMSHENDSDPTKILTQSAVDYADNLIKSLDSSNSQ